MKRKQKSRQRQKQSPKNYLLTTSGRRKADQVVVDRNQGAGQGVDPRLALRHLAPKVKVSTDHNTEASIVKSKRLNQRKLM